MNAFVHEARGSMTPQRVAKIFLAAGGKCHVCKRVLRPGDDYQIDHVLALENAGNDEDANLAPICEWCHKPKTADDHALAAHGKRMATKHVVPKRFKKSKWRKW